MKGHHLNKFKLHSSLIPYIKHIEIIDHATQVINPYKVYPSLTMTMGFQLQGRLYSLSNDGQSTPLKSSGITGLLKYYKTFQATNEKTKSILVRFYPWGIPHLFNLPACALTNQSLGLSDLLDVAAINNLEENIQAMQCPHEAVKNIQEFFIHRLAKQHRSFSTHSRVIVIAQQLERHPSVNSIAKLANHYGYSKRSLERHFQENIGLSPKRFMLTARFQHILRQLQTGSNWEFIAEKWNYYDQAHFIKDIKQFTGNTPTQLLQTLS